METKQSEISQNGKSVRLDADVMTTLADNRQGFESPNDCLKRLLEQNNCGSQNNQKQESTNVDQDVRS